jgi:hypothetical protein
MLLRLLNRNEGDSRFQTLQNKSFYQSYKYQKEDAVNTIISTFFNIYIEIFQVFHDNIHE